MTDVTPFELDRDLAGAYRLLGACHRLLAGELPRPRFDEFAATLRHPAATVTRHCWIAGDPADPDGFAALSLPRRGPTGYCTMLLVHPRRRRRGIGRALLAAVRTRTGAADKHVLQCWYGDDPAGAAFAATIDGRVSNRLQQSMLRLPARNGEPGEEARTDPNGTVRQGRAAPDTARRGRTEPGGANHALAADPGRADHALAADPGGAHHALAADPGGANRALAGDPGGAGGPRAADRDRRYERCRYRLLSWCDGAPEKLLASYATAREAINDAPHDDDMPVFRFRPESVRRLEDTATRRDQRLHVTVATAADGTVAGFTELRIATRPGSVAFTTDTAVIASHRGRGLAGQLKAERLRALAAERPDVTTVVSTNEITNAAMLAVNRAAGFRPVATQTLVYLHP